MELETSQQLEDELTRQMESSQKWLEKERETEAAEVRKMKIFTLCLAALEQKKILSRRILSVSGKRWENSRKSLPL